ncbi:uncharacterized protein LOC110700108 [Chenopodium quinoa]|uniref:uncharacterized protein LOC110700108 n=1 Tax=Chenopodium quinoa TaxID=63459 RepID=UPI000B78BAE4|nr:uncharacterized protein LOC110700108 [Chenopodium quinoa]
MDTLEVQKRLEWMRCANRTDNLYINGVNSFLQFAFGDLEMNSDLGEEEKKVPYPCNRCNNGPHKTRDEIYTNLIVNGIVQGYVRWIYHGEFKPPQKKSRNDLGDSARDDIYRMIHDRFSPGVSNNDDIDDMLDAEQQPKEFDQPRYKKDTKEAKMFENLMRDAQQTLYPGCNEFSKLSFILKLFQIKCMDGMTNKAFTSMLHMFKNALPKGADLPSNYYEARKMITNLGFDYEKIEACENDYSEAWKHLDKEYPTFSAETRNVRLGLASDGFNPFGGLRSDYSIWPVVVVVYNLPPWMCMKQPHTILSLLIPGKSGPENNIDVYLQPLIEELKDLWETGAQTYDASRNEYFQMCASLLWTINDFPAHAKDNRQFLPTDHKWRDNKSFNGKVEKRGPPRKLSSNEILEQLEDLEGMKFGKTMKLPKRDDN